RSPSSHREASPEIATPRNITSEIEQIVEPFDIDSSLKIGGSAADAGVEQTARVFDQAEVIFEEAPLHERQTADGNPEAAPANTETAIQEVPFYRILEEEEQEDEQRTIIDVIRLSTRSHKKAILIGLGSLVGILMLFTVMDTMMRWTSYGAAIYDLLFPPAIRIVSFPPDAQVYLDDKLLPQTTPMAIERISPGVHKLMLLLPRFEPIVRSIQVPPKGGVIVEGNDANPSNQPYVFRFKTTLQLTSKPSGAEVYLNGIKYTQPTPCRVVWEVGDPLQIEMERPGFARLSGFTLNTVEGVETIEDRRLWRFQRIEPDREHFAIEGTFAKAIVLTSIPNNAEIYLDGSERPVGITGFTNRLLLTVGMHTVALRKRGYLSKTFTLRIDENSPDEIQEVLSRVVKVFAKDPLDPGDNDIGATILQLTYDNTSTRLSAKTPCELTLLPFKYTALLRKDGYKDHTLMIPAGEQMVVARLERIEAPVELLVLDEATDAPLEHVEIICRSLRKRNNQEISFTPTDAAGISAQELPPGEYRFVARKEGYRLLTKDFVVTTSNPNRLILKMQAL
ncbi:MAG: PEGA domain-containing protein, partial [candidate division KSB1 bacterium]|nr:PEGA domain-containing protein [candidate division KSB1 bacterium]